MNDSFEIGQAQIKVSALDKFMTLYVALSLGRTVATKEYKAALQAAIKELCKNICDFIEREQAAN